MSNATIGNARALFGILFIQYCSYAFFYLMDHIYDIHPEYYTKLKFDGNDNAKAKGGPKDKNAADQRGAGNQHGDEDDDVEEEEGESQGEDDDDDDEDDGR